MNQNFEAHKIEVQIKRFGIDIIVLRKMKNDFGELDYEKYPIAHIRGLLYKSQYAAANNVIVTSDTSSYRQKVNAGFLCLADELMLIELKPQDIVIANGKKYLVQELTDVGDWGKIFDVSLEVIDHGTKARLE